MNYRKITLFLLYGAITAGFSLHQYQIYDQSLEEIRPYIHYYETSESDASETESLTESETFTSFTTEPFSESVEITSKESTEFLAETIPMETESLEITEIQEITEIEEMNGIQFPLELNQATFEELCALPEIGTVTAQKILDFREQNGGFLNLPQLLEISGIGEYTYHLILPYLYLETEYFPPESEFPEASEFLEIPEEIQRLSLPEETAPPEIPVINLNTATKEQLMLLPNCDESLADEIILLRDRDIHIFHNIIEITFAEHVTPELLSQWQNYLSVDDDGSTQISDEYSYMQNNENQNH